MAGHQPRKPFQAPVWHQPDGNPVSCVEKIKVLNENLTELRQIRAVLDQLITSLQNPYRKS